MNLSKPYPHYCATHAVYYGSPTDTIPATMCPLCGIAKELRAQPASRTYEVARALSWVDAVEHSAPGLPQQSAEPVAWMMPNGQPYLNRAGVAGEIPLFAASPGPSELVERPNPETQVVAEIMQRDGRFSFHSLVPIEQFHDGMKLYRSPVESAPALAPFEKPKKEPETFEPSNEGSFLDLGGYF